MSVGVEELEGSLEAISTRAILPSASVYAVSRRNLEQQYFLEDESPFDINNGRKQRQGFVGRRTRGKSSSVSSGISTSAGQASWPFTVANCTQRESTALTVAITSADRRSSLRDRSSVPPLRDGSVRVRMRTHLFVRTKLLPNDLADRYAAVYGACRRERARALRGCPIRLSRKESFSMCPICSVTE